jgi:RNA polymerase sigma-70 factor (ECF subfamily)
MRDVEKIDSDAQLMARVAQKDEAAYRDLMSRHLDKIYRSAVVMLQDQTLAEDITQDAFLKLWRQASSWKAHAQVSTWLYRVAHNLCIDKLRQSNRFSDEEVPEMADPSPSPIDQKIARDQNNTVQAAIAVLPTRQRMALLMVHFEETSNIEAARRMEISVEALESLLARARRKLKDLLLAEQNDFSGGGT